MEISLSMNDAYSVKTNWLHVPEYYDTKLEIEFPGAKIFNIYHINGIYYGIKFKSEEDLIIFKLKYSDEIYNGYLKIRL